MARGKRHRSIENDNEDAGIDDNNNGATLNGQCKDTNEESLVDHAAEPPHYDTICMFTVDQYRQDDPDQAPDNENASQINVFTVRPQEIWKTFPRYHRIICIPPHLVPRHCFLYPLVSSSSPLGANEEYALQDSIIIHDPTFAPTYERVALIVELRCFNDDHAVLRIFKYDFMSEQDPKLASILRKQKQNLGLGQLSSNELERELIATNAMAVINISLVKRRVEVVHVRPEEGNTVPDRGYWWTHTFDSVTNDFN